jgi:rhodanese-related sulfurtransferase
MMAVNATRRFRGLGMLLTMIAAIMPLSAYAGHDVPEDDPNYYLPMPPDRARDLLEAGEHLLFVDLRTPDEFKKDRITGAMSLPLADLPSQYEEKIPHSGRVVLYCACPPGNNQEGESFRLLRDGGYRNVTVLVGGISEWRKLGYPIETGSPAK